MDHYNPSPPYRYIYPQQGSDYISAQSTTRPIANHLPKNQLPQTSLVSAALSISCTNRDRHDSYGYQYSQNNDGYTSTPSTKESDFVWDKYNEPELSPSTDFMGQNWGSGFQGDGESLGHLSLPDDPLPSATGVSDSLNQTLLWSKPQDDPNLSTNMLVGLFSPNLSQYESSYDVNEIPQELNTASVQQDDQTDAGVFQFALEDQEATPKPNTTSMPTNTHGVGTHRNTLVGQTYSGPATMQSTVGNSSSPKIVQRSALGPKRRRLTEDENQEEERNYPQNGSPTPSANGHTHGLQPGAAAMVHLWQSQNPNRSPNKAELKALKLLTRASSIAILRVFLPNDLSAINIPPANTNPLPARPGGRPDPENTCVAKKRSLLPWNKPRDSKKMYSCTRKCGSTFAKKGDWTRHEQINYPQHSWFCPLSCLSIFGRKDKLRNHIRDVHKMNHETFDLDSTRAYHASQFLKLCGFCGDSCASWLMWTEHVGKHFEDRIDGGPWEMSRWRDPWIDDQADRSTGGNDDGDDNGNYEDSDYDDSQDDPRDSTDDSGPGIGRPPGPTKGSGSSRSRSSRGASSHSNGGGKSSSYYQAGQQFSVPFRAMKTAQIVPRIDSVPRATRTQQNGRHNETEDCSRGKIVNASTWPLAKDQSVPEPSMGSVLSTERTGPLIDLACTGKSQRNAHNAELAPHLEGKSQFLASSQSASGSQDDFEIESYTSSRVCQPASQSPHHLTGGPRSHASATNAIQKAFGLSELYTPTSENPVFDIEPLHVYQHRHEVAEPSNLKSAFLWLPTCSDLKSDPKVGEPVSVRGLTAAESQTSSLIDEPKVDIDPRTNGKFIAVMGESGSRNSTFIRMASGLDAVDGRLSYIILIGAPGVNDTPHSLTLVDMSGLIHTPHTKMEMLDDIAASRLDSTYRNTSHSKRIRNLNNFRNHCGEDWFENVVLATTYWGTAEKASDLSKAISNENQLEWSRRHIRNFLKYYQHQ